MNGAQSKIELTHSGALPVALHLHLNTFEGMGWIRRVLRNQSGWLQIAKASMDTYWGRWTAPLVVAVTDGDQLLSRPVAEALLDMRATNPQPPQDMPDEALEGHMEMAFWDFLGRCDIQHLRLLDEAEAELAAGIQREQDRGETILAEVEVYIAQLSRKRRAEVDEVTRNNIANRIAMLENKQAEASAWLVRRLAEIRQEGEKRDADILEMLQNHGSLHVVQTIRWTARHPNEATQVSSRRRGAWHRPTDPYAFDLRGSTNDLDSLRRALRLGRLHSRLPADILRQEKRQLEEQRRRPLGLQTGGTGPLERLSRVSQAWMEADAEVKRPEPVDPAEQKRIAFNAALLRTKAQQESAKRRRDAARREREITALLSEFSTIAELDRQLDRISGNGIENRRRARLIRDAIKHLSRSALAANSAEPAFPANTLMPANKEPAASVADDSIDIDALIDQTMRDMSTDL